MLGKHKTHKKISVTQIYTTYRKRKTCKSRILGHGLSLFVRNTKIGTKVWELLYSRQVSSPFQATNMELTLIKVYLETAHKPDNRMAEVLLLHVAM